jgi:hypothetical protein
MADLDSYHDMCQVCCRSGGEMYVCDGLDGRQCRNVVCMDCAQEVGETFLCVQCKDLAKAKKEAADAEKRADAAEAGQAKAEKEATEAKAGEAKANKKRIREYNLFAMFKNEEMNEEMLKNKKQKQRHEQ